MTRPGKVCHFVTLADFNPWLERRLACKYTPCLVGLLDAVAPVLRGFATIRSQAEELGVALLREESGSQTHTGAPASEASASLTAVRQRVDNIIHLIDDIANGVPECPLDSEYLSSFLTHGRDCLARLGRNLAPLQLLADAPYGELSTASRKALKALAALKVSSRSSGLERTDLDLEP